jgi:hypothetical protein
VGFRLCRECHKLVSEEARACPHCGVPDPADSEHSGSWVSKHRGTLALVFGLLGLEVAWFHHQVKLLAGPPVTVQAATVDSFPGYRSLRGVWLGAKLYYRDTRTYVGQITSLQCPDPTPRGSAWRCVEVEFADGHREWVRRQVGEKLYLARLPE